MVNDYKYLAVTATINGIMFRRLMSIAEGETEHMCIECPQSPSELLQMARRSMCNFNYGDINPIDKPLCGLYVYPRDYVTEMTARMGLAARLGILREELKEPLFATPMEAAVFGLEDTKFGYYLDGYYVEFMTYTHDELDDIYYIHYIIEVDKER